MKKFLNIKGIVRDGATIAVGVIIVLGLLLITAGFALAEENTLLGGDRFEHTGMGSWRIGAGQFAGKTVAMSGYQGQWIINHKVGIGLIGEEMGFQEKMKLTIDGSEYDVSSSTTGLDVEVFTGGANLIHPLYGVMIGGGTIDSKRTSDLWRENEVYFVAEPRIGVELNVTKWMRINGTASWRFASGVHSELFDRSDVEGWNVLLALKFGSF